MTDIDSGKDEKKGLKITFNTEDGGKDVDASAGKKKGSLSGDDEKLVFETSKDVKVRTL